MNYPGNPSLAEEIQRKILDTFGQSLDLASAGKREEALLGCDFVLRLDPLFEPARVLQGRVEAEDGAVPVDDLAADLAAVLTGPATAPAEEPAAGEPAASTGPGAPDSASSEAAESAPGSLLDSAEITLGEPEIEISREPAPPPASEEDEAALLESALSLDALTADPGGEAVAEEDAVADGAADAAAPREPAAALDQESEDRVAELLAEGQSSFDEGEYQSAIDAWSRIFLIDIEHPEANRRIELARKLKAEVERKLEEKYHEGLAELESGKLDAAKNTFAELLEMQPGHIQAREYLDRLSAGEFERPADEEPEPQAEPAQVVAPAPEPPDLELERDLDAGEFDFPAEMYEPPAQPGEAGGAQTRPPSSRRTLFVIAGLVLALVLVAAWLLWRNWDRAFPSAEEEAAVQPVARVDPIDRATALYIEGQAAMAIAQLRRLPPAHPQYAEAQALIAQWEAASEQADDDELSDESKAERDRLVALAREAFANREFLAAEELFELARQQAPLDDGAAALAAETTDRLEPLRSEIDIFRQGEWAYALRSLWSKHEEDPGNPDIVRLMVDGYYNLAVRELQRGDLDAALENLAEANVLDGSDGEIQRLLAFAETYRQRDQDLLYRIFVKYLPFR